MHNAGYPSSGNGSTGIGGLIVFAAILAGIGFGVLMMFAERYVGAVTPREEVAASGPAAVEPVEAAPEALEMDVSVLESSRVTDAARLDELWFSLPSGQIVERNHAARKHGSDADLARSVFREKLCPPERYLELENKAERKKMFLCQLSPNEIAIWVVQFAAIGDKVIEKTAFVVRSSEQYNYWFAAVQRTYSIVPGAVP